MRLSTVLGIRRLKLRNRIFSLGILITGMLSLVFGVVTFYGQNAGNFVMSVDTASRLRGIVLSTDRSFEVKSTRLMSDPINEAREVTYAWLKLDEIGSTNGNFVDIDHDYVAYTFYVKNDGHETLDLGYYIAITDLYNNLDLGIRVLVIEEGEETLYMKRDTISGDFYPEEMPDAQYFLTDKMIMRKVIVNFRPEQIRKFSVVVWLEGNDPDTNDDLLGGMIKMQMNFTVNKLD